MRPHLLRRLPRSWLGLFAIAALVVAGSACQMNVGVTTTMNAGGEGTFRILFAFDKEFVEVVKRSPKGTDTLQQLRSVAGQFTGSGWQVGTAEPDGGLRIDISRAFDDPRDLERAIAGVAGAQQSALSFLNVFRDFRLENDSGFFRTSSLVSGQIDLTPRRLSPSFPITKDLQAALQQVPRTVFHFTVRVELPGSVEAFTGDPDRVDGGTIEWSAPFGKTTTFSARAGGMRATGITTVAGPPAAAIVVAGIWMLRRRRHRRAPVEGWEVGSTTGGGIDDAEGTSGGVSAGNQVTDGDPGVSGTRS